MTVETCPLHKTTASQFYYLLIYICDQNTKADFATAHCGSILTDLRRVGFGMIYTEDIYICSGDKYVFTTAHSSMYASYTVEYLSNW